MLTEQELVQKLASEQPPAPDMEHVTTEDDTPVDNLPSEKNQRLLTEPLYSGWTPPDDKPFLAAANVGVFYMTKAAPVVPDLLVSLDVEIADDWWRKEHRSYFIWEFGKPPDLALEIVSNDEGDEAAGKRKKYARMRVHWYVVFDPLKYVMDDVLTVFRLDGTEYVIHHAGEPRFPTCFTLNPASVPLGLTLWEGDFEGKRSEWLRWTDADGNLIPTGKERADAAEQREAHERAQKERLAAKLRELGVDPDSL